MPNHWRKCYACGNVAIHSESVVPEVLCTQCGSQDTRLMKQAPKFAHNNGAPIDYDVGAYLVASTEERLHIIWQAHQASRDDGQRRFFEGQMLALSYDLAEHPEWFDNGCMCADCRTIC